jgi:hypothetical protein
MGAMPEATAILANSSRELRLKTCPVGTACDEYQLEQDRIVFRHDTIDWPSVPAKTSATIIIK